MNTAQGMTLNVNAQDLINTAELFKNSGSRVANITEEMMNLVTGLTCVWSGDASEVYISKFCALDDDIMRMIGMINEHVVDLEAMAENYISAENYGVDYAEVLSTDVIV
ncbi:MAG: WXG100 family type VII secretion target [Oscillospiraceae bacterium]|nr:WXG100 family type VII secretion target [Oscillospiraceae bacterium]